MIAGTVGTVVCAAGFVFMSRRPRRTARPCRTCGVSVPDSDLCPTCRHEAAEALRHANAERVQHQKAEEEEGRRQRDYEAEQREQRAREAEEARVRELELARQAQAEQERADQNEAASVRVAVVDEDRAAATDRHADGTSAAPESDAFDPYAILRVSRDASADTIHAAYELARSKYDPDVVAHLGDEAQAHFKAKAEAVELAYQILSAGK
jgi:flagellar biosynthesis GTPase FlhF